MILGHVRIPWAVGFVVAFCVAAAMSSSAVAAKRNVVLVVTDDQSPDMGCYGNGVIKTPNMDKLAEDGTRFTFSFCTTASCSASRSVILTGLHNHANGHYGHQHGRIGSLDAPPGEETWRVRDLCIA